MLGKYRDEQPVLFDILSNEILSNKISHAYLFNVSSSKNAFPFIYGFIKSILCPKHALDNDGCSDCNICKTIDDGNFPDISIIEPDGQFIKKEQLVNLQKDFTTTSLYNGKKIYIIKYAENLNASSANSILKFLEEPEKDIIAILLTKNVNNVLPTILSRCQVLNFLGESNSTGIKDYIKNLYFEVCGEEIDDTKADTLIDNLINYIIYYEKHGIDVMTHNASMWFEYFTDKKLNNIGYNLLLCYYKDVINYKLNRNIELYTDYIDLIKESASNNSMDKLYKKVYYIIEASDRNKLNVNLALNLDNLLIRMEDL